MVTFLPTPIGNLEDITYRTVKTLQEAQILFCEDTRVTKRLLSLLEEKLGVVFEQEKEFIPLHSHNEKEVLGSLELDIFNKNCVYVSDAGMPCISDPGAAFVSFCQEKTIEYDLLPGASALNVAYGMSGFLSKEFVFYGFLHQKKSERIKELKTILNFPYPVIVYESPKRILSLVEEIATVDEERTLYLIKEISKLNQKFYKGSAKDLKEALKDVSHKGEWVAVVDGKKEGEITDEVVQTILDLEISLKDKSKILGKLTNKPSKQWYKELL